MTWRRVRIGRVNLAARAAVVAAALGVPVAVALIGGDAAPRAREVVVRGPVPARAEVERAAVSLAAPGPDLIAEVTALRVAGDVEALLALVARARGAEDPVLARAAALAIASLRVIPGDRATQALHDLARGTEAPALERTFALAALWERGEREFVEAEGRDSSEPAIRSKARVLSRRAAE